MPPRRFCSAWPGVRPALGVARRPSRSEPSAVEWRGSGRDRGPPGMALGRERAGAVSRQSAWLSTSARDDLTDEGPGCPTLAWRHGSAQRGPCLRPVPGRRQGAVRRGLARSGRAEPGAPQAGTDRRVKAVGGAKESRSRRRQSQHSPNSAVLNRAQHRSIRNSPHHR